MSASPLEKMARRTGKTTALFGISSESVDLRGTKVTMPRANRLIPQHWAWCRRNQWPYSGGYASALIWAANGRRWP